jgi:hypothetical protein
VLNLRLAIDRRTVAGDMASRDCERWITDLVTFTLVVVAHLFLPVQSNAATGDITIERPALGSIIYLQTSARFAGSVSSIVFRGKQYVDTQDHGRELQSASSFDGLGECFNPTEAGSFADANKQTTSSYLLDAKAGANWLTTKTDMAFWLPPAFAYKNQCGMNPAVRHAINKDIRGGHILMKRIELGDAGEPNVVSDHLTYIVPEPHSSATFEAATIYTPVEFSRRLVLNFSTGNVEPTTVVGEQGYPVILATSDGKHAVGIFSSALPQTGLGYGTFGFSDTNKINCVFREYNIFAGQNFRYSCDFVLGTLSEVTASIIAMHDRSIRDSVE